MAFLSSISFILFWGRFRKMLTNPFVGDDSLLPHSQRVAPVRAFRALVIVHRQDRRPLTIRFFFILEATTRKRKKMKYTLTFEGVQPSKSQLRGGSVDSGALHFCFAPGAAGAPAAAQVSEQQQPEQRYSFYQVQSSSSAFRCARTRVHSKRWWLLVPRLFARKVMERSAGPDCIHTLLPPGLLLLVGSLQRTSSGFRDGQELAVRFQFGRQSRSSLLQRRSCFKIYTLEEYCSSLSLFRIPPKFCFPGFRK